MSSTRPPHPTTAFPPGNSNPSIETWRAEAVEALRKATLQGAQSPQVRGAAEALEIPLDTVAPPAARDKTARVSTRVANNDAISEEADEEDPNATAGHRRRRGGKKEPSRRDSLKRREALLKGKEGSRRRQKWENDRLLGNPYVEPPQPHDWAPQPTHKIHPTVPYVLAPLWDDRVLARARAQREREAEAQRQTAARRGGAGYTGTAVPRELRERLKRAKGARGLLKDLEAQIREFVQGWEEQKKKKKKKNGNNNNSGGVAAGAGKEVPVAGKGGTAKEEETKGPTTPTKKKKKQTSGVRAAAAAKKEKAQKAPDEPEPPASSDPDSSDEEIVFVGRNGSMRDIPRSPLTPQMSDSSSPSSSDDESESPSTVHINPPQQPPHHRDDKLLVTSPAHDPAARFARYLVHALAAYYGLRAYSVTTAGAPPHRDAYVGLGAPGPAGLPTPLWGRV